MKTFNNNHIIYFYCSISSQLALRLPDRSRKMSYSSSNLFHSLRLPPPSIYDVQTNITGKICNIAKVSRPSFEIGTFATLMKYNLVKRTLKCAEVSRQSFDETGVIVLTKSNPVETRRIVLDSTVRDIVWHTVHSKLA